MKKGNLPQKKKSTFQRSNGHLDISLPSLPHPTL